MIAEKHYSLRAAARLVGVAPKTIKRWLAEDLNICLPRVRRGGKVLIREQDIERVVARRRDARTR
jgi:predicted site-specific integrase-resolvase